MSGASGSNAILPRPRVGLLTTSPLQEEPRHYVRDMGSCRSSDLQVLLALAVALTTFVIVWLIQDSITAILNKLPITLGEFANIPELLVTLAALPFILLFNMLALPGALVVSVSEPLCGCGTAVAAPILIALATLSGLTSGGLWLYRRGKKPGEDHNLTFPREYLSGNPKGHPRTP